MCHVSCVLCHVSRVTCHMSHVTWKKKKKFFCFSFFLSGGASLSRVCYQQGLPRLVIYIVHINAKFSSCKFCLILYYCCKSFLAELICSLFYPTKIMVKWILHSTNILLKIVWNTHLSPFDMHISCIKRRISIQNVIPELRGPFFFNGLTNMGLHRKRPTA